MTSSSPLSALLAAAHALRQSAITRVERASAPSPRDQAQEAGNQALDKDHRRRRPTERKGSQLSDVADMSPRQAATTLDAVAKLRDMYGEGGLEVKASRGEETTTSLATYTRWLQERAGEAAADPDTQANLFSLKT